ALLGRRTAGRWDRLRCRWGGGWRRGTGRGGGRGRARGGRGGGRRRGGRGLSCRGGSGCRGRGGGGPSYGRGSRGRSSRRRGGARPRGRGGARRLRRAGLCVRRRARLGRGGPDPLHPRRGGADPLLEIGRALGGAASPLAQALELARLREGEERQRRDADQ